MIMLIVQVILIQDTLKLMDIVLVEHVEQLFMNFLMFLNPFLYTVAIKIVDQHLMVGRWIEFVTIM